jgi:DNA topoisomerase IA
VTLGYKPEQTAQIAQRLFEEGLITYHRTDSQNFSAEALSEIRAYAASNNLPLPPKARTWKSKESAQEAHEAIRPPTWNNAMLGLMMTRRSSTISSGPVLWLLSLPTRNTA